MTPFAALHVPGRPLLLPNAWDVTSALLLAAEGFPAVGTTSLGITAAAGLPDGAGAGRGLTVALAGALVPRLGVPLSVDLEGGYAEEPVRVADLVAELADLGVAGVNLEDGLPGGGLRPVQQHGHRAGGGRGGARAVRERAHRHLVGGSSCRPGGDAP